MKKYYLTTYYRFFYSVVCLITTVPLIIFLYPIWNLPVFGVLFFLMISLVAIRFVYWIRSESITVLDQGIEYDTPGTTFVARWEDFEKIAPCWRFAIKQEGLAVDKSRFRIKKSIIIGNSPSHALFDYPQKICIPLNCFANQWREAELGQQIKHYAPHLFP